MSDYISKSVLVEKLEKGQIAIQDKIGDISVSAMYETINLVIDEINRQPTLDETEIIRKSFERVVERLKELKTNAFDDESVVISDAIEIVKEECGINE